MNPTADINFPQMMTDVGPLVGAAEVREYEPQRWVIGFNEDLEIEVEQDAEEGKIVLSAYLGQPPAGGEAAAYKMLLQVSALWRETGGLRMGLDPEDDIVVQIHDFPLAGLELEELRNYLENFVAVAIENQAVLAGPGEEFNAAAADLAVVAAAA